MTMRAFAYCFLLSGLFQLSACVSTEDGGEASGASSMPGYELGFQKGRADGISGAASNFEQHASLYSEADRAGFSTGYEKGYNEGIKPGASFGQPLTATTGTSSVTIKEGDRTVSVCSTALPNVETTKFISEQQQIVVKSRGEHGPATVELFNTANGAKLGSVKAFEIKNGQPTWAAGMEE